MSWGPWDGVERGHELEMCNILYFTLSGITIKIYFFASLTFAAMNFI